MVTWQQRMASTDAEFVVMQVGINDSFVPGFTVNDYGWHIQEIIRIARLYGKHIIVCTPNPINLPQNSNIWEFKHRILAIAPQLGLRVINHFDTILQTGATWQKFLPDNVHPCEDYYKFKGATSAMTILSLFK